MRIRAVELRQLEIPMVEPLAAAHGVLTSRQCIVVRALTDVGEGWGECAALNEPTYTAEWSDGAYLLLRDLLVPAVLAAGEITPDDVAPLLRPFKYHHTAKASLEMAVLDAHLKAEGRSLAAHWNVTETSVECAIVVGLLDDDRLEHTVERHLERGYRQLKLKIVPGRDLYRIDRLRKAFPDLTVRVDANGSYDWRDAHHRALLRDIDERGLALIEQPFPSDHARDYLEFVPTVKTPIALDESITSIDRAMDAIVLGTCDVMALKAALLGGYLTAKRLHETCVANGLATMVGGLIDAPIGRAANLALAALPCDDRFPAEIAPDGRWFRDRLNVAPVEMRDGRIEVPTEPGIGVEIDMVTLDRLTRRLHVAHG